VAPGHTDALEVSAELGRLSEAVAVPRGAQPAVVDAVAASNPGLLLGSDHLADTTPYAPLAWAGLALVVVRIGRSGDCRWWLAGA